MMASNISPGMPYARRISYRFDLLIESNAFREIEIYKKDSCFKLFRLYSFYKSSHC